MPQFAVRKQNDVPPINRAPREVQELQREYESFISAVSSSGSVGELHLTQEENMRSVKVRLRRAASRLKQPIEIWDKSGLVYFQASAKKSK